MERRATGLGKRCSALVLGVALGGNLTAVEQGAGTRFFEARIRPILVEHCYECHSEEAGKRKGGLLLDRESGWLEGGDTGKAVVPGNLKASLLATAVHYQDEDLEMPPEGPLSAEEVRLLEQWIRRGAPGPKDDMGETSFSQLGDQEVLFSKAREHWAFQPLKKPDVGEGTDHPVDQLIREELTRQELSPSPPADPRTLIRRLTYDLTGLPPAEPDVRRFVESYRANRKSALEALIQSLLDDPGFGEHLGRLWLDVARYADTDSSYRADTKTPHYFPYAFAYRDYVIRAFNEDKPFDQFVREQLAADLMGFDENAPELAALGFLTVGPHRNRSDQDRIDDLIDVTTRGLMGVTVACARCHDHKFEPVPTADYYSLYGVFASVEAPDPLAESKFPLLQGYPVEADVKADYETKRQAVEKKIEEAGSKKAKNNNRSIAQKIRETELAELLLFHPGAPARTMVVKERKNPVTPVVFLRGDARNRGESVPRRFLELLDPEQSAYPKNESGRGQLAEQIVDPQNPLTARVLVNRVWGWLMGSYLVDTPSDFGLQGGLPTHPEVLDWLAADFMEQGWSLKHLVRTLVSSGTYQQRSLHREEMASRDPANHYYWRANRKRLSIEAIRDSMLAVSAQLDRRPGGRAEKLWGEGYSQRRAIYGYINRFNLDPTLRTFDFPSPMQTEGKRTESIVATQALFGLNAPFVIDQAAALVTLEAFQNCQSDEERADWLFRRVLQREAHSVEKERIGKVVAQQAAFLERVNDRNTQPWALVAQSLLHSNEFLYLD